VKSYPTFFFNFISPLPHIVPSLIALYSTTDRCCATAKENIKIPTFHTQKLSDFFQPNLTHTYPSNRDPLPPPRFRQESHLPHTLGGLPQCTIFSNLNNSKNYNAHFGAICWNIFIKIFLAVCKIILSIIPKFIKIERFLGTL